MRPLIIVLTLTVLFLAPAAAFAEEDARALEDGDDVTLVDTNLRIGPMILTSFSLCTVAVGAGFGWQADQEYDNWKAAQNAGDGQEMDRIADDVKTHSVVGNVLMFTGAALAATGIIWWIVSARKNRAKREEGEGLALWQPFIGPGSASLVVRF